MTTIRRDRVDVRRVMVLLGAIAVLVLQAPSADAHAVLQESEPGFDQVVARSPEQVTMVFSEPVEVSFGSVRVFDTEGERVDAGDAGHVGDDPRQVGTTLEPDLADGTYTATYKVVSADAHRIEGAFVFHVGKPGPRPQGIAGDVLGGESGSGGLAGVLFGVARWVNYLGLISLAGASVFMFVVWRRLRGAMLQRPPQVEAAFARRWSRVLMVSWVAVTAATLASVILQTATAGAIPLSEAVAPSVFAQVFDTKYGLVALIKLSALVALAVVWWPAAKAGSALNRGAPQGASVGAAAALPDVPAGLVGFGGALLLLLLLTPGASGHAGSTPPAALNVAIDGLHLAAAAAWIGGLVTLVLAAFPATRGESERERVKLLAPVVARFSDLAMVAVGVIAATGIYQSWLHVRALSGLTGATYGLVLLGKLAAFLPLIALGVVNNRWHKPGIERAAASPTPDGRALRTLRRLVGIELLLAGVVLALTALLVNLAPARMEAGVAGPFQDRIRLGGDNAEVLVVPNEIGRNEVHVTATTPEGAPARIRDLRVLFTMPENGIGPIEAEGRRLAPGHFVVQGTQLSIPGEWKLEIVARRSLFEEDRAEIDVTVNG